MNVSFDKAWCLRMAALEGDQEIGAGWLAQDPYWSDDALERGMAELGTAPALGAGDRGFKSLCPDHQSS